MTASEFPLATSYKPGWEQHHRAVVETIASLSSEQLAFPVAPHYLSIGALLEHMVGARYNWFSNWMGEDGQWAERADESGVSAADNLVAMFEQSWNVIASALDRWTPADLEQLISPPASYQEWLRKKGVLEEEPPHTRQWIVWHVMEHEIHHGGELSLALGTHGVSSFYTW